ncbi:MAG: rod shape-determining protein MreD [Peptococcaceae bacterium]|nr:rod shape-determining protein MreD [Peptococcaceae bacterium]
MIRLFLLVSLLIGAIFVQGTFLELLAFQGFKPDLLLIIVTFHAFLNGSKEGALLGFIGGVFQDLTIGNFIGMNGLVLMLGGYIAGMLETKLYKDSLIIIFLLVGFIAFFTQSLNYLLLALFEVNTSFIVAFLEIIIPTSIYTAIVAPIFYGTYYRSSTSGYLSSKKM